MQLIRLSVLFNLLPFGVGACVMFVGVIVSMWSRSVMDPSRFGFRVLVTMAFATSDPVAGQCSPFRYTQ